MTPDPGPVGLVPAAGIGTRLRMTGPKELAPLADQYPIIEFALHALRESGVRRAIVVISPAKEAIRQALGDGGKLGVEISYATQPQPLGLPNAVRCARQQLADSRVVLVLPDTVFVPTDAPRRLISALAQHAADVALGVFPTDEPDQLAPVLSSPGGAVLRVCDKPAVPPARNTWGMLAWITAFSDFCAAHGSARPDAAEMTMSSVLNLAVHHGMAVIAEAMPGGQYVDAGTSAGLARARALIQAGGAERSREGVEEDRRPGRSR